MTTVAGPLTERARDLWQAWATRGTPPRPAPTELIRTLYGFWCAALALKVLGSGWDVAWHFRWLRDDLAPPHLLDTAGTVLVIALIAFHAWTGYGVDRPSLRLMLVGIVIFLVAIPIDVVNHRINGLDITAWSVTHGLLYLGTALLLAGAVRGWWRYGSGSLRTPVLLLLWAFVLENVWFPTGQQEYGVLAVKAWDRGRPDAEAVLLQFVADQIGRPVDRSVVLHFALPMPDWLYPVWLIAAAGFVLVLARWMIGIRWAATVVAAAYVGYRCVAWAVLVAGGFPPSALPFLLIAVAVAVDLVFLVRMPDSLRPLLGALLVGLAAFGGSAAQQEKAPIPPIDPVGFGTGTLVLAVLWILTWVLVRSGPFRRWAAEH
jgi:hypothetical protein